MATLVDGTHERSACKSFIYAQGIFQEVYLHMSTESGTYSSVSAFPASSLKASKAARNEEDASF